jgi:hypothetical protein
MTVDAWRCRPGCREWRRDGNRPFDGFAAAPPARSILTGPFDFDEPLRLRYSHIDTLRISPKQCLKQATAHSHHDHTFASRRPA